MAGGGYEMAARRLTLSNQARCLGDGNVRMVRFQDSSRDSRDETAKD